MIRPIVTKTEDFIAAVIRGNVGESFQGITPVQGDPFYGKVPSGVRYLSRVLWFACKGSWHNSVDGGLEHLLHSNYGPMEYHPSGSFYIEALEDNSEMVCLVPRDKSAYWTRKRIELLPGESLTVPSIDSRQVIFLCGGDIEANGANLDRLSLATLKEGQAADLYSPSGASIVHSYRSGTYEPILYSGEYKSEYIIP